MSLKTLKAIAPLVDGIPSALGAAVVALVKAALRGNDNAEKQRRIQRALKALASEEAAEAAIRKSLEGS